MFPRENEFDRDIVRAAERYTVPVEVIKAVIAQESRFNPAAYRAEPKIGDASRGLMQVLERTARGLGMTGPVEQLYTPAINIDLGTRLLSENIKAARPTHGSSILEVALSAYNAGFSKDRAGDAKRDAAGVIVNYESYVVPVVRYLGYFAAQRAQSHPAVIEAIDKVDAGGASSSESGTAVPVWLYVLAAVLALYYVVPLLRLRS
jgi:soluble lytic murein transglycosylase-like protein